MAVLVQSATGHLNGWPNYPFDQEECCARATVAATRSQSLTVIVSPVDMMGIMGMIPESVCEGFLLKISCGIRLLIIVISSSSSSHHHFIIISSSSHHHHLLLLSLSLSSSFLFSPSLSLSLSSSFLFSPSLSLSRSSFSSIFSAPQWRRKSCPSNPLRESGC